MEACGPLTREGKGLSRKRLCGEGFRDSCFVKLSGNLCAKMILLLHNQGPEMGGLGGPFQQPGSATLSPTRTPLLYLAAP